MSFLTETIAVTFTGPWWAATAYMAFTLYGMLRFGLWLGGIVLRRLRRRPA